MAGQAARRPPESREDRIGLLSSGYGPPSCIVGRVLFTCPDSSSARIRSKRFLEMPRVDEGQGPRPSSILSYIFRIGQKGGGIGYMV